MSYIEDQANKFWEEIQEVIVNQLILTLEQEIELTKLIKEFNDWAIEENEALIKRLKDKAETSDQAEEYNHLEAQTINVKDKSRVLQFGFDKMLELGKTLIHEVDWAGNLTIKVYNLGNTYTRKIKTSFKVSYE